MSFDNASFYSIFISSLSSLSSVNFKFWASSPPFNNTPYLFLDESAEYDRLVGAHVVLNFTSSSFSLSST